MISDLTVSKAHSSSCNGEATGHYLAQQTLSTHYISITKSLHLHHHAA